MPKFGWFKVGSLHPLAEYEADFMQMDREYVKLFDRAVDAESVATLKAAIRLDKGQDVRVIK